MAEYQMPLFEGEADRQETRGLVLKASAARPLTSAQRAFNRLIARVEQLQSLMQSEIRMLDEALAYYGEHLHPREQHLNILRKEMIRALSPFLDNKQLRKIDHKFLKSLIGDLLREIGMEEGSLQDSDLRAIFERVYGVDLEQAEREEIQETRSMMNEMFDEFGIDMDLSDLQPGMTPEQFARKAAEMAAAIQQSAERENQPRSKRRRSKRQKEQDARLEQAEQVRKKSIATIYKQLARVLHPDLEMDPQRRDEKVALMQQLTAAYKKNDLHTLLRMELEWIHGEQRDLERLTQEKLAIYNQVLKEQIRDLEFQIHDLRYHPRYEPLMDPMDVFGGAQTDGPARAQSMDRTIADMERSLQRLKSPEALKEVRTVLRDYRNLPEFPF